MNPELAAAFEEGTLVRPSPHQPSLVHLVRALATLSGVWGLDSLPATRKLLDLIVPNEHLIFILLDGLGMNLLQRLPAGSFLSRRFMRAIQATCPSTTACALTSVATGEWPGHHGITGWFTHLPDRGLTCMPLPFQERFTKQPLQERGIGRCDVLPLDSFYGQMRVRTLTLLPGPIVNTTYATYSRGDTAGAGYASIAGAVDQCIAHVLSAPDPSYTHIYIPDIDTRCHKASVLDPCVLSLVMDIDAQIARMADALAGRARIVVSADHGLIDIRKLDQWVLTQGDPLLELLQSPPSGDARLPMFHVREGCRGAFTGMFRERFADGMILLTAEEVEQLELIGPAPLSPVARSRLGDFVGVCRRAVTLSYAGPGDPIRPYIGQHAGLSSDEMLVPLCIA